MMKGFVHVSMMHINRSFAAAITRPTFHKFVGYNSKNARNGKTMSKIAKQGLYKV